MLITHEVDIDLVNPGPAPRIQVKQGDVMTRNVRINLYANGTEWNIAGDVSAVIRYSAYDTGNQMLTHGMYDTLEDGSLAYLFMGNALEIMLLGDMMARPGLVNVDVLLVEGAKKLATFGFEICVSQAPVAGEN